MPNFVVVTKGSKYAHIVEGTSRDEVLKAYAKESLHLVGKPESMRTSMKREITLYELDDGVDYDMEGDIDIRIRKKEDPK